MGGLSVPVVARGMPKAAGERKFRGKEGFFFEKKKQKTFFCLAGGGQRRCWSRKHRAAGDTERVVTVSSAAGDGCPVQCAADIDQAGARIGPVTASREGV
ncbi:MAG TPA: hypothetical protein VMB71_16045 [Acetobacteraceae bacterium]|nr:hypothetical protein [Acetobacteraceae bacterium]